MTVEAVSDEAIRFNALTFQRFNVALTLLHAQRED